MIFIMPPLTMLQSARFQAAPGYREVVSDPMRPVSDIVPPVMLVSDVPPLMEPDSEPVPPVVVSFRGALHAASDMAIMAARMKVDERFMVVLRWGGTARAPPEP